MSKFRENEGARHSKLSVREEIISVLSKEQKRGLSWILLNYRRTTSVLCSCTNSKRSPQERSLQREQAPRGQQGRQRSQTAPGPPGRRSRRRRTLRAGRSHGRLRSRHLLCTERNGGARLPASCAAEVLPRSSRGERATRAEATQQSKNNGNSTEVLFLSTFLAVAQGKTRSYCQNPNWLCSRVQI